MKWRIPILLGSCRAGRQSLAVARYAQARVAEDSRLEPILLDLAEYRFPLMDQRLEEMTAPPAGLLEFSGHLRDADGILIVSPEYKHGYPGVLKNALDYLAPGAFRQRPVAIATVSAGGFGGLDCLAQLRLVCLALGGTPIPTAFPVSHVQEKVDANARLLDTSLEFKFAAFLGEFLWYVEAMVLQRARQAAA